MSVLWGELVLGIAIVVLLAWAVVLQHRGEAGDRPAGGDTTRLMPATPPARGAAAAAAVPPGRTA